MKTNDAKITIFDIARLSTVDGDGFRTTVFFKGCNLACKWCHNPEGINKNPQLLFYKEKCVGCGECKNACKNKLLACDVCGNCADVCGTLARVVAGKTKTVDEIFDVIIQDKIFYETSNGGVTFSGGECMLQIDGLTSISKKCREHGINVAIDTAGNVPYDYFKKVMPNVNSFLYDVKCVSDNLHRAYTGVSNSLILSNLKRLADEFDGEIIIRVPFIPEFNGGDEMQNIRSFISKIKNKRVEVLPYHPLGLNKYNALNLDYNHFSEPTASEIATLNQLFNR